MPSMLSLRWVLLQFAVVVLMFHKTAFVSSYASSPNLLQRLVLKVGAGKSMRERVVERYFDGVQKQDFEQIKSCFHPQGTQIRDVCGASNSARMATPDQLGQRCIEFLQAHPDTKVKFHMPPTCARGSSKWVFANWYEEGTFSGESQGIKPDGSVLDVEGQTRFLVNDDLKITEMVVTRTFSVWEQKLQEKN